VVEERQALDERVLRPHHAVDPLQHQIGVAVVVAEGVEREGQRATIEREGCIAWQGFLGARPMSAKAFVCLTEV